MKFRRGGGYAAKKRVTFVEPETCWEDSDTAPGSGLGIPLPDIQEIQNSEKENEK